MEITALAQQAISVVAEHLAAVAAGVVDAAEQGAATTLYTLLRDRLDQSALGATVLDQLQKQPQDPDRQQVAAAVVAEHASADPQFAEMLRWSIGWQVQQSATGQVGRHSPMNVTANRDVRLRRSYVSAGDIDNSRRSIRIGTGGWILAALLFVGGGTATGFVISESNEKPDPLSIGIDIGEDGIRDTAEAVRDAYERRDADLLCGIARQVEPGLIYGGRGTGTVLTPVECSQDLQATFDQLDFRFTAESGTLGVERIIRGKQLENPEELGYQLDEDEVAVVMVNRDSEAACRGWELLLTRQDGRWVLELNKFIKRYVDMNYDAGVHCEDFF